MSVDLSHAERIAVLETEVKMVRDQMTAANQKLDDLLALRHKGVGAFWLASTLVGTSIIGTITVIAGMFK